MAKNCEFCGKIMVNPELTHCSDECIFESVKSSSSINPQVYTWRQENFESGIFENPSEYEQN